MTKFILILLLPIGICAKSSFGTVFGGSLVGSFAGSSISNAVFNRPNRQQPQVVEKPVYIQQQPQQVYVQHDYAQYSGISDRERELDLRERELAIRERELAARGL